MKKFVGLLCVAVLMFGVAGVASAVPFESIIDWNDTSFGQDRGYKLIDDEDEPWYDLLVPNPDPYPFVYEHTVIFDPAAVSVESATLTLTHKGDSGWLEAWFLTDTGNTLLGDLQHATILDGWVDQQFVLNSAMLAAVSGNSWTIGFKVKENTDSVAWWDADLDTLLLDKSVLAGEYNPVPEPSTVLLLGVGLLGLIGLGRKKFKK